MNFNQNMLPAISNDASMSISRNFSDRKQVARLFLFSPRNIINVCKRPHIYNFNMEFINDLENNIDELGNLGVSGNIVGMSFMNKYRSSLDAVTPSANGILMQTKYLSDYWTFILQIDNDQFRNQNGENVFGGPILTNRYIYSGFCTDEPYSKLNGSITPNPRCFLRITHVTSLANENRFRPSGGTVKKMIVSSDVDFIPPVTTMQLNNNANYYISPQAVNQSCVMSETDSDVFISGNKNLASYNDKPIPSSTVFNSPKHHLQTIVNAFMSSYDERNAESVVANSMSTDRFGFGSDINVFKTNIANKLNVGYTDDLLSIDPSKLYSIAELKEIFPMLECIPCSAEKISNNDIVDQQHPSRTNIACSLVSTSLPMFASQAGLCEIAFEYSSYVPNADIISLNGPSDAIKFRNWASWSPEEVSVTKLRLDAVLRMVREQLAPMIRNIGGEFAMCVSCNSAGECDIILNFYDDGPVMNNGIYETPLILGGINSPLIGSYNHLSHNGAHMSTLLTAMASKFDNSFETMQMNYPVQNQFENNIPQNVIDIFSNNKF